MYIIIVLFIILGIASWFDLKEHRIPNELVMIGIVSGIACSYSLSEVFGKALSLLVLFAIGAFRLMGAGDIKLWMVISCYTGLGKSCIIICLAAIYLIFYGFLRNRQEFGLILKHLLFSFRQMRKPILIEQEAYPFAPFMLAGAITFYLWRYFL